MLAVDGCWEKLPIHCRSALQAQHLKSAFSIRPCTTWCQELSCTDNLDSENVIRMQMDLSALLSLALTRSWTPKWVATFTLMVQPCRGPRLSLFTLTSYLSLANDICRGTAAALKALYTSTGAPAVWKACRGLSCHMHR